MFSTIRTLLAGAGAKAEAAVRQEFAVELIDQKIREAGEAQKAAKAGLAGLIQRERAEDRQIAALEARIGDLAGRARQALAAGNEPLAAEAAAAIAQMENELAVRRETLLRMQARVVRLRQSVETATRRLIDLKHGALMARTVQREQVLQRRLGAGLAGAGPMAEAEELIAGVLEADDPVEAGEILDEIERGLSHADLPERMAAQGFGRPLKVTAAQVLDRLRESA